MPPAAHPCPCTSSILAGAALLLALPFTAPAQDLCSLVPPGGDPSTLPVEDYERNAGIHGKCVTLYPSGQVTIFLFATPDIARSQVEQHRTYTLTDHMGLETDPFPTVTAAGVGDVGIEVNKEQVPPGNIDSPVRYQIAFSRGCSMALVNAGGALGMSFIMDAQGEGEWRAQQDWVRSSAAHVDAGLASVPCPGGDAPVTPVELPGSLGATLTCDHNFDDPGLVVCTATPTNQRPDASLEWDWSFDGSPQGVFGSELTLNGVLPGEHTVGVVARDVTNDLVSSPQSVTFYKGLPGEDGDDGPGLAPILIGTAVLGATAVGVGRWVNGRRRKPAPAGRAPPGAGTGRAGTPPVVRKGRPGPAAAAPARPGRPPETAPATPPPQAGPRPVRPPETVAGVKPRPKAPPETATATSPKPPGTTTPTKPPDPRDRQRKEGEVWLEADQSRIEVRGDGKAVVAVQVRAWKLVEGVRTDASNEVLPGQEASDEKKVHVQRQAGWCHLAIRGTHVGNTPFVGKVTVTGQALRPGACVTPIDVTVVVHPVTVEVRITAWKEGFKRQERIATLPKSCAKVRGVVEGGNLPSDVPQPSGRAALFVDTLRGGDAQKASDGADRRVAHAHCSASLRVDGGAWSSPVEVRTNEKGEFWFSLPDRMVRVYGAEIASYELPTAIDMSLNAEIERSLRTYDQAITDFTKDTEHIPVRSAYAQVRQLCTEYPARFLHQLRTHKESDYRKLASALNCLRCSVLFALKYRKDFRRQRPLVNLTAKEALGSVINVVTDLVPVAAKFYGWVAGEPIKFTFGKYFFELWSLPQIFFWFGVNLQKVPGLRWLGKLVNLAVKLVRAPATYADDVVGLAIEKAIQLARKAGLSEEYLAKLAGRDPNDIDITRLFKDDAAGSSEMVQGLKGLVAILLGLLRTAFKLFCLFLHAVVLLAFWGVKVVAELIKAMPWGPAYEGSKSTVGEVIEQYLGDWLGNAYDALGSFFEGVLNALFLPVTAVTGAPAFQGLAGKDPVDMVLDKLIALEDLDERTAEPLRKAYDSSLALDVLEDWQTAVTKVTREEITLMNGWQKAAESQRVLEEISAWAILAVKIIQMFTFSAAFFAERFASVLRATLAKLPASSSAPWAVRNRATVAAYDARQKGFLDFAGDTEKIVDMLELALIKTPIFLKEIVALVCVYYLAPTRIRDLYKWA